MKVSYSSRSETERLSKAQESIAVAVSPTPIAGIAQAKAFTLAVEALASPGKKIIEELNSYLKTLNNQNNK